MSYPSQLSFQQKSALVDALLACPSMTDSASRDAILAELPESIRHSAKRHSSNRTDVLNLISACLNYPDGLAALAEVIRFQEGDSLAMQGLDDLLLDLVGGGAGPAATPAPAGGIRRRHLETRLAELNAGYEKLSGQIELLLKDQGRELDSVRRQVLAERLAEARQARDAVVADMEQIEAQLQGLP